MSPKMGDVHLSCPLSCLPGNTHCVSCCPMMGEPLALCICVCECVCVCACVRACVSE